jgi:hypothetical protein
MRPKTLMAGEASGRIPTSRLLQSLAKMMAFLLFLCIACAFGHPEAVCVISIWGIWLWVAVPNRKTRVLTALGLGLTALVWLAATLLWSYFAKGLEGTHFNQDRGYWEVLMRASENLIDLSFRSFAYLSVSISLQKGARKSCLTQVALKSVG